MELRALLDARKAQGGPVSLTLCKEPKEGWRVIKGRRKGKAASPVLSVTETRNSFSVLEDQCSGDSEKTDEITLSSGKVVVVGDSQVRGLGRMFCARDVRRRMCVCLPGAGVGDVDERLEEGRVSLLSSASVQEGTT